VYLLAVFCLVAGLALYFSSPRQAAREQRRASVGSLNGDGQQASEPVSAVRSYRVAPVDGPRSVEVTGLLEPVRSVVVAAEVEGRVIEVPVDDHARVEAGDVLARLDPVLLRAAVDRAEASVQRAASARRLAELELERRRGLARKDVASAAELDRAESEATERSAALLEARAVLEDSRARLERSEIRAPFAGFVHHLHVDPGAYLRPGSQVADIVDLSEVEVGISVTDRQIVALGVGDPVVVEVALYAGEEFEGAIVGLGRATDAGSRKYPVTTRLPNPDERLLPGMVATVHLGLPSAGTVLELPRTAIRREFEIDYVFVLEPDGEDGARARRRRVVSRAVPFSPESVEIVTGLAAGERVAVSGVRELRDGVAVRVSGDGL
jgi:RND family efflux transporter MFP subunit